AVLELCARSHRRVAWGAYAIAALYVAANIPVARVLSTPLTWPMLRAAGGPLSDSIRYYATWQNALLFSAVAFLGPLSPLMLRRVPRAPLVGGLLLCAALGPLAAARVDTRGFDRNAWTALIPPRVSRSDAPDAPGAYRTGFDRTPVADLSRWRAA